MPRAMSSALKAALAGSFRPVVFVEVNFLSGPVRVWSGIGDITWNSHVWSGLGSLGSISVIEDSSAIIANGVSLSCSGIDSALLSDVLHDFQVGLPALIYLGALDSGGVPIADPVTAWAGRMDQPEASVGETTSTITINCENRLVEMNTAVDRRYTNDDQQLDHPGDRGFEFTPSLVSSSVYWGRTPLQQYSGQ